MNTGTRVEMEVIIEARPSEGMTLDELEVRMKELGNVVIERRPDCLLMVHSKETVLEITRG